METGDMRSYPASIPFDVLRMLPSGKPDSDLVWYVVDQGGIMRPCIRWAWLDDTGIRLGFFNLENGDYISDSRNTILK